MLLTEKYKDILGSEKYSPLSESEQSIVAQIIENTVREAEKTVNESTTTADIAAFTPVLIPMVRRVFPNLVANELVGVQPLAMPTGYLYAMVTRYTGTSANPVVPQAKGQILELGDATTFVVGGPITSSSAVGTVVYKEGSSVVVALTSGTFAAGNSVDDASPYASAATTVTAAYSNQMMFTKILPGYSGPVATSVGEALGSDMKEVGFDIERVTAEAKTRALKGKYTLEMYQDLKSMHGLDAEKELTDLMGAELQFEIDRQTVNFVNGLATPVSDLSVNALGGRWEIEKLRLLGIKIANESREIGRLTRRGPGNVLLVSPKTSVALEAIGSFILATSKFAGDSTMSGINPAKVGVFDNRYKVIVDNYANSDYVNVLYKGGEKAAVGFFAPYVGATFTKVVDPSNGQPALIAKTRYDLVANPLNPESYSRSFNLNFASTSLA